MGLHIMASKRIPRKVKKALKYVYLLPRRNGNMIQYGGVGIIGNRSKLDFNSQVAEDNSKYIAKLKELIS